MLRKELGSELHVLPFQLLQEEQSRTTLSKLGYAQVLFTPSECLIDSIQRETMKKFLGATFDGWRECFQDPIEAARIVRNAVRTQFPNDIKSIGVSKQQPDHWIDTEAFAAESIDLCSNYVKTTACGGKLGVIEPEIWQESSSWLVENLPSCKHIHTKDQKSQFIQKTLDHTGIWSVDEQIMQGDALARRISVNTKQRSEEALKVLGRRPSLAVITVGEEPIGGTHKNASRRLQLYGTLSAR